jgi:hypothetical protein
LFIWLLDGTAVLYFDLLLCDLLSFDNWELYNWVEGVVVLLPTVGQVIYDIAVLRIPFLFVSFGLDLTILGLLISSATCALLLFIWLYDGTQVLYFDVVFLCVLLWCGLLSSCNRELYDGIVGVVVLVPKFGPLIYDIIVRRTPFRFVSFGLDLSIWMLLISSATCMVLLFWLWDGTAVILNVDFLCLCVMRWFVLLTSGNRTISDWFEGVVVVTPSVGQMIYGIAVSRDLVSFGLGLTLWGLLISSAICTLLLFIWLDDVAAMVLYVNVFFVCVVLWCALLGSGNQKLYDWLGFVAVLAPTVG